MPTQQEIAAALSSLPHEQLLRMREGAPLDRQIELAPFEHRAFAREAVGENPLMSLPIGAAIPLYQIQKGLMGGSRTPMSWEQMKQGYIGVGEGVKEAIARLLK